MSLRANNTPVPKHAEYISSRLARFAPALEQATQERFAERTFEEFIAAQSHTRYEVIDTKTGTSTIKTIVPAQLLGIWPEAVMSALMFRMRWSEAELLRLLQTWNCQRTQWVYLPANEGSQACTHS